MLVGLSTSVLTSDILSTDLLAADDVLVTVFGFYIIFKIFPPPTPSLSNTKELDPVSYKTGYLLPSRLDAPLPGSNKVVNKFHVQQSQVQIEIHLMFT